MRTPLAAVALAAGLAAAVPASPAGAAERWAPALPAYGTATMVCDDNDQNALCFGLRCGGGRPLEFLWVATGDNFAGPAPARISVDGEAVGILTFAPRPAADSTLESFYEAVAPYDADGHARLVERLRAGRSMTIDFETPDNPRANPAPIDLSLAGSSREIARILAACPAPPAPAPAATPDGQRGLDRASAMAQEIAVACDGRPGRFEPEGVVEADLTGDGREDLVLSHDGVVCEGGAARSAVCGIRACYYIVYVATDDGLVQRHEGLSVGVRLRSGEPPRLDLLGHDLTKHALLWTGSGFAERDR